MNAAVETLSDAVERLTIAEELLESRLLDEARIAFDLAEQAGADPDRCSAGRWDVGMLAGRFEDAWRESDAIRSRGSHDPHRFWNGKPIHGKRLIIRSLHGLGDAVQMFRYASLLRSGASAVIYEVPPRMVSLARCFRDVEDVITWGDQAPAEPLQWDLQLEITELPYVFRTTVNQLPIKDSYIRVPDAQIESTADLMGTRRCPRVGVVWACGDWNPQRNFPLAFVEELVREKGIEFWNLQGNGFADEAKHLSLRDNRALSEGLVPLASLIANLDLVITPDTLAAHLAGAIGKPAWVLLQHAADWRWMVKRSDTPWYRSVRLFRQPSPGDWGSVFIDIRERLRSYRQSGEGALLF